MKKNPSIFWLVSYPKSGNTWCRVFLSNYLFGGDAPVSINSLKDIPFASGRGLVDHYYGVNSSEMTEEEAWDFRRELFRIIHENSEGIKIIKAHEAYSRNALANFFADEITAGVVYVVRNPLDVAVSLANHMNEPVDHIVDYMADEGFRMSIPGEKWKSQFPQSLLSWSSHVKSWTEEYPGIVHMIRYEDLSRNPEREFSRLLTYLNQVPDEKRLERAIKFSSFQSLQAQEAREGFCEKFADSKVFFREGKSGSWQRLLSPDQVTRVRENHEMMMKKMEYI